VKLYRVTTSSGQGVFRAGKLLVEEHPELWDQVRDKLKWLPRVGKDYDSSTSYFTKVGYDAYRNSGLMGWHEKHLGPLTIEETESKEKPLYQDRAQVLLKSAASVAPDKVVKQDIYVLHAVPKGNREIIKKHGLLSSEALLKNPEVLAAVLAARRGTTSEETEEEFRARVEEKLKDSFFGTSVKGPSVLFGEPDPKKITDAHPVRRLNTETLRINLSRLLKDIPETRISGSELKPYDPEGPEHQGDERHYDISLDDVSEYASRAPEELWKRYNEPEGRRYASNVPHAQIITPSGVIPPEYIEFDKVADLTKIAPKWSNRDHLLIALREHLADTQAAMKSGKDLDKEMVDLALITAAYRKSQVPEELHRTRLAKFTETAKYPSLANKEATLLQKVAASVAQALYHQRHRPASPSEDQKKAGNYRKAHIRIHGIPVTLENMRGQYRAGTDSNGKHWRRQLRHHYGYILRTEGRDGDQLDAFVGPNPKSELVFVINQVRPDSGRFDELKAMLGFDTEEEAKRGYLSNFEAGWKGLGSIRSMTIDQFKVWLQEGDHTKQASRACFSSLSKVFFPKQALSTQESKMPDVSANEKRVTELPRPYRASALNPIPGFPQRAAGRAAALHTAYPELGKASWSVRHPYWTGFLSGLGGAAVGGAAGAAIAGAASLHESRIALKDPVYSGTWGPEGNVDYDDGAVWLGTAIGAALGGYTAGTIARQIYLKKVRAASAAAEGAEFSEQAARKRLEEIGRRNVPMAYVKGLLFPVGAYEKGEAEQLISLIQNNPKVRGGVTAGLQTGFTIVAPLGAPIVSSLESGGAVRKARKMTTKPVLEEEALPKPALTPA
jgi:hypothetical protein